MWCAHHDRTEMCSDYCDLAAKAGGEAGPWWHRQARTTCVTRHLTSRRRALCAGSALRIESPAVLNFEDRAEKRPAGLSAAHPSLPCATISGTRRGNGGDVRGVTGGDESLRESWRSSRQDRRPEKAESRPMGGVDGYRGRRAGRRDGRPSVHAENLASVMCRSNFPPSHGDWW